MNDNYILIVFLILLSLALSYISLVSVKFSDSPEKICRDYNGTLYKTSEGDKICIKGLTGINFNKEIQK